MNREGKCRPMEPRKAPKPVVHIKTEEDILEETQARCAAAA